MLLLAAVTPLAMAGQASAATVVGAVAASAASTSSPGSADRAAGGLPSAPPPASPTTSTPHPDGPSDLNEYVPDSTGPGDAGQAQAKARGVHPDTGGTVSVTDSEVHGTLTLTPFMYGTVTSSSGGTVQAFFYARTTGSSTWNLANGTEVDGASGSQIQWTFADQMGTAGGSYQWMMQGCQAGTCSADTAVQSFTIDSAVAAGNRAFMSYFSRQISSTSTLRVNEGTGNLVLTSAGLNIQGINNLGLNFVNTYNSLQDGGLNRSDFGVRWTNSIADLQLGEGVGSQLYLYGPTGYLAGFLKPGTKWMPTSGLDADASYTAPNYTFTFHHDKDGFHAGDTITFNGSSNLLTAIKDKHGNAITVGYNPSVAGQVTSITDAQGRTVTLSNYNSLGQAQTVTDSTGRVLTYGYDSSGNLTSFADAGVAAGLAGDAATGYAYTAGRLTQITDPAGRVTQITYVSGTGVVSSITSGYGTASASTTTFSFYPVGDSHCTTQPAYACSVVAQDRANATPTVGAATYESATYYYDKSSRVVDSYDAYGHKQANTWDVNSQRADHLGQDEHPERVHRDVRRRRQQQPADGKGRHRDDRDQHLHRHRPPLPAGHLHPAEHRLHPHLHPNRVHLHRRRFLHHLRRRHPGHPGRGQRVLHLPGRRDE